MQSTLAILAGVITLLGAVPYTRDILAHKVQPARSTRFMFLVLMLFALVQQSQLGTTWGLFLIYAEITIALLILGLSLKYGVGGMNRLDIYCYLLLAIDFALWKITNNALLAIHLTILADLIACIPTIVKTYKYPKSETPLFFFLGALSGFISVFSEGTLSYDQIAFPLYIGIINASVMVLTLRKTPTLNTPNFKDEVNVNTLI